MSGEKGQRHGPGFFAAKFRYPQASLVVTGHCPCVTCVKDCTTDQAFADAQFTVAGDEIVAPAVCGENGQLSFV